MKHYEETVSMIKQIITHAKEEGVSELILTFDHYIPNPKMGYPRVHMNCHIPQNGGRELDYEEKSDPSATRFMDRAMGPDEV